MINVLERNKEIMAMYNNGKTLEYIGNNFKITRSRAQQILSKMIRQNILDQLGFDLRKMSKEEKEMLEVAVKEEIKEIYQNRGFIERDKRADELKEEMKLLPDYQNFSCVSKYVKALKINASTLKVLFPDIYEYLSNKTKNKWSQHYDRCRQCGTTSIRHQSYGLCRKCYLKSDYFKDIAEASRLRNKDKWKAKQREYQKEYVKRPEIKEKFRRLNDLKNFGGKREEVLARNNYKCVKCGISRDKSYKKYERDLYIRHIDNDKNNHSLSNLTSLCYKCFNKLAKFVPKN